MHLGRWVVGVWVGLGALASAVKQTATVQAHLEVFEIEK